MARRRPAKDTSMRIILNQPPPPLNEASSQQSGNRPETTARGAVLQAPNEQRRSLRLHLNEPTAFPVGLNYPDIRPLQEALAQMHKVSPEHVLVTAGADAGLDIAARSKPAGEAIVLDADFPRYTEHSSNAGHSVVTVPIALGSRPWRFPSAKFRRAIGEKTSLVMVSTVANPTGLRLPKGVVATVRNRAPGALLVLDEVYAAFTDDDYAGYAAETLGVVSVRSLSKVGYPHLRVGYMIGHPETIGAMRRFTSPFAVATNSVNEALNAVHAREGWLATATRQVEARIWLERELRRRGFPVVSNAANWLLADFGPGAGKLLRTLAGRGIQIQPQRHPALRGWMRISTPDVNAMAAFVAILDQITAAPFIERDATLVFEGRLSPEALAKFSFVTRLSGNWVDLDHFVVTFPTCEQLTQFQEALVNVGGNISEGPGLWPYDFCEAGVDFPNGLAMHFATLVMPIGGIVVLAAPHKPGDQLDRFREARGPAAVHHVALRVENVATAARHWQDRGFRPLKLLDDGELAQQFLQNERGQLIELIHRRAGGNATFSCGNTLGLRLSETTKNDETESPS